MRFNSNGQIHCCYSLKRYNNGIFLHSLKANRSTFMIDHLPHDALIAACKACHTQTCQKISSREKLNLTRVIFLYLKEIFNLRRSNNSIGEYFDNLTNMSDQTYLLILRLLHIGCGTMWAGTVIFVAFFLDPAVKSSGPDGTRFMQQLVKTNRFPIVIMLLALITVLAGSLLIWKVSGV